MVTVPGSWTRAIVALLVTVVVAQQGQAQTTSGWRVSTPEAQGLAAAPLTRLDSAIASGHYGLVDRLVIIRNEQLVLNKRYVQDYRAVSSGRTSALGCGIGACASAADVHPYNYLHPDWHPYPGGRDVHTLQSVTKSVSSALIGIAIGRGEIPGVDAPLLSFFEGRDLSGVDPRLREATVEDLLTMRSGIEWHEQDRPLDETNTTLQLERSSDWVSFTLSQPMDAAPGAKWVYNSGGSHLMSAIIRSATGQTIDRYAQTHLFEPLGVREFHWKFEPGGLPDTEGGLYLEALDLARFGQLYLNDGMWQGRRILPEGWARSSTMSHVDNVNAPGWGYGYQWWRLDRDGIDIWAGLGFGGQYLLVLPARNIVAVVNSWNLFGDPGGNVLNDLIVALLAASRPS
jgi:CubicO group peptidase (beta-lactamase class C family)